MTLGIITSIQQSNAYQNVASSAVGRLAGRSVEVIGAASAVVSPYFRSKWASYPALAITFFLGFIVAVEVAEKARHWAPCKHKESELRCQVRTGGELLLAAGAWAATVYAISKFAGLPCGKRGSIVGGTILLGLGVVGQIRSSI